MHIYWRSICVSCFSWSRVARNKILAFGLIIALAAAAVPARAAGWDGANFTSADIGNPALIGSSTFTNLGLTMTAGGLDIGGNSDQGRFTYREQTGDFDLKVRIQSLGNSDVWAKAGLMARESLEANSASAAVLATPNLSGCFLLTRAAAGSPTVMKGNFPANYPATWLRVQRTGDVFQGYASLDGQSWSLLGTATMALTNRVLLGFMAASHSTNQVTTAEFRDFAEAAGGSVGGLPVSSESLGPCSRKTGLVISEIMYHPAARTDGKNLEFVELYNTNPFFEDISGYRLAGDIDFTFPNGTVLPGGGFLIVAKAPADMQSVYGLARVLGPYSQALKRSGTVRLLDRIDSIYLEINYSNQPPWPVAADGTGHSLVLARPSYGEGNPQAWSASGLKGGSPGQVGAVRTGPLQNVTINEFLANSELPQKDYIELYNHGNSPQDLSGCFLSDDPATNKFRLPVGTVIPARGFIVFAEDQLDFALNSEGETIYFTNPDENQVLDAVRFEPQAVGIAMGRVPDGAGEFYPLAKQTPGAANGDILVHDIVINEIMYNPISGDPDDQYVELFNRGKTATDLGGWRFTAGIDLVMPSPTLLPAGGYLVIARNVSHLRQTYPHLGAGTTVGNFQGKLARGGERLALAKPESTVDPVTGETRTTYAVVDEVAYQTGGRWPRWADGGGSSLELIDPRSNHRLASNWADSDETHKAEWTTIEATGVLELGVGTIDSLHVLLLGEGECLVDNVEVLGSDGTTNLIANSTFENGLGNWVCQGDHIRSSLETTEGYQSQKSLHLRASNQGDTGANRIRVPLASSTALRPGQTATLRAKVRWLRGFPEIVLRLKGNYLEATGRLALSANPGTPGAPNSQMRPNVGPAIYAVSHTPVLPTANEPAVVVARVNDPDGLSKLTMKYRVDPSTNYVEVPMTDDGQGGDAIANDGIYSATIPGQATDKLVAFVIEAVDNNATPATASFPKDAPVRECLVRFGEPYSASSFGTYRLWLTAANITEWTRRLVLSNEELDGTFVYGNQRVVYNMGIRYSGSPWHQPAYSTPVGGQCTYAVSVPSDDQVLGTTSFNKIHAPGNGPGDDPTIQCEQTAYWMVRQLGLPWNYQRYVNVFVNGKRRGSYMEDTQVPGNDVIKEHFPGNTDGPLYKLGGWYEFSAASSGVMDFGYQTVWCSLNNYTTTGGAKKRERYRWNWAARATQGTANDYSQVYALVDAANTPAGGPFTANMDAVADMEQWLRTFAIEHAVGNWDSFGYRNAQNMYAYLPKNDRWKLLIWDFNIVLGNSGSDPADTSNLFSFNFADRGMARIYSNPEFVRAYLRTLKEIADGPLVKENVEPILDARYAAFRANGISVSSPTSIKNYISSQRRNLLRYLTNAVVDFAITSNQGQDFNTNQNWFVLTGVAPLEVKTIKVNGHEYAVTWDSALAWHVVLPLPERTNAISIQGYDLKGNALSAARTAMAAVFTGPIEAPQDHLVINEIMYQPMVTDGEYLEIHNTSRQSVFDLSGYRLSGVDFNFPDGTLIEPDGYVLVVKNRAVFAATYGNDAIIAGEYSGRLDPAGETLRLIRPGTGNSPDLVINAVTYRSELPWPAGARGTGASLQLIDPTIDTDRVGNWTAISPDLATHPAWKFVSVTGTAQSSKLLLYHSPFQELPNPQDIRGSWIGAIGAPPQEYDMTIDFQNASNQWTGYFYGQDLTTTLSDLKVASISISFGLTGTGGTINFSGRLSTNGNTISGTFTQSGQTTTFSLNRQAVNIVWGGDVYLDDLKLVRGTVADAGPNLIRDGDFEVPLAGSWNIASNHAATSLSTEIKHSGRSSLHLIANRGGQDQDSAVWQDTEPLVAGETYTLSYWYLPSTNGVDLTVRLADGNLASVHPLAPDRIATPGSANSASASLPPFPSLFLNEVQPNNVNGLADRLGHWGPWVELVNRSLQPVPLSGFYLSDNDSQLARWAFPTNAVIQPNQYLIVWLDGAPEESTASEWHASFLLAPDQGSITLAKAIGPRTVVIDYLNYRQVGADRSYGFDPETLADQRHAFDFPTPGAPNNPAMRPAKIYLNEWMADNTRSYADMADGKYKDWLELYNPNDEVVNLSGYRLTDDITNTAKFIIPPGISIAARGYLLVWADSEPTLNSATGSDLHVNFKLSKGGETIGLFAPDGTLVDSVTFGKQTADISQGRPSDALDRHDVFFAVPTPASANPAGQGGPNGVLKITAWTLSANGSIVLTWRAEPGRSYQLQYKSSFSDPVWHDLGSVVPAMAESATAVAEGGSAIPERFYRVSLRP